MTGRLPHPWFARVQHDLVKRLLWTARDCRDLGRRPEPGELVATLFDPEGQPTSALALFRQLSEDAPPGLALEKFEAAISACVEAAKTNELEGVLALQNAFEQLRGGP